MIRLLLVIVGLPLLLGGIALILIGVLGDNDDEAPVATSTPTSAVTRTASSTPETPTPEANVCEANPDPGTADVIVVDTPTSGAVVTSPVSVRGKIAAFEATFRITIFDTSGHVIAEKTGHSAVGQALSAFTEAVPFTAAGRTPACLWVYEPSARDGRPTHVVQIPVVLQP